MNPKDILKITINLTIVCVLAGIILASTYAKTEPVKVRAEEREKQLALKSLLPEADKISEIGKVQLIEGKPEGDIYAGDKSGQTIGYVTDAIGKGYSSFIKMLVAVDPQYRIKAIDILSHGETPGLGDGITERWFQDQFKGKTVDQLEVVKVETKDKIQALSGATISSRGVTNGVKDAIIKLEGKLKEESTKAQGVTEKSPENPGTSR